MSGVTSIRPDELVEILSADFINCWIPIQQTTLTGSVASVTFSSIPSTYRTLIFINQMETDRAGQDLDTAILRFNGDSGNNYDRMLFRLLGNNTTTASSNIATSSGYAGITEAATSRNSKSPGMIIIPGYKLTDREKQFLGFSGHIGNVSANTDLIFEQIVGNWRNTSAITSVQFLSATASNFVSGSIFDLYGVL